MACTAFFPFKKYIRKQQKISINIKKNSRSNCREKNDLMDENVSLLAIVSNAIGFARSI